MCVKLPETALPGTAFFGCGVLRNRMGEMEAKLGDSEVRDNDLGRQFGVTARWPTESRLPASKVILKKHINHMNL